MENRTSKFNESTSMSRVAKNTDLYKKINDEELTNYTVRSNATVIGNQEPEIDVEKIKKILDTRYNSAPQRKSIRIEPKEEIKLKYEDTKEYDINAVIEKAKNDKTDDYDEQRAKKMRDTQYDILNNLKIEKGPVDEDNDYSEKKQEELMELINTITINEKKKKDKIKDFDENDGFDLLEDLKGGDDTQVYGSMAEIVDEQKNITDEEISKNKETAKDNKKDDKIDNTFYTNNLFNKRDFVDDEKIIDESKYNVWIKVLIVMVIIAFLVGLYLFLKSFLGF